LWSSVYAFAHFLFPASGMLLTREWQL
jgi:hypothetical protein